VFILVFVLATGVFWEVLEFALGDLITVYGVDDIVTDMVFNTVGAVIVAVWGTGYVTGLTRFVRERLRAS
jgi:VanZ family protein